MGTCCGTICRHRILVTGAIKIWLKFVVGNAVTPSTGPPMSQLLACPTTWDITIAPVSDGFYDTGRPKRQTGSSMVTWPTRQWHQSIDVKMLPWFPNEIGWCFLCPRKKFGDHQFALWLCPRKSGTADCRNPETVPEKKSGTISLRFDHWLLPRNCMIRYLRGLVYQSASGMLWTRSSAVAERPRDVSCLSVVSWPSHYRSQDQPSNIIKNMITFACTENYTAYEIIYCMTKY